MDQISNLERGVALHTAKALSCEMRPIVEYWDDNRKSHIFILEAANRPQHNVTTYCTIGLSGHPLFHNGVEFPARVEIIGACGSIFKDFGSVISTAAFCIINSGWFCAPGKIFPEIIDMYGLSNTMNDIYFASPFLWPSLEKSILIDAKTVAWLLAVPVSRDETEFAVRFGPQALENLFEERDIDIFDLNRLPVV